MPTSDMREQLLDAAVQVLKADGPTAVTTKRIAREAGCSEGSIYNHFSTKEDLLACAISERVGGFLAIADDLQDLVGQGEIRDHLRTLAAAALDFYRERSPVVGLALRDPERLFERARTAHAAGFGPWRQLDRLADWLRAEQALGRVDQDADPHAAISALLGTCLYHALLGRTWGPELAPDDDTAIERAVTASWQGLAP
jgi:AcrR family transcriptional regulator